MTTQVIETHAGRRLCIEVAGDPDGDVIVFHNGSPNSRLLYPPDADDAVGRGACLVGYDRPGYGGSTRRAGRSVAAAVDDLRAIAAALGVDRLVTWGISGGGPHALACAALAPDLVAAAAALASVAPYDAPGLEFFEGMGERNIEDFRFAADDPDAAAVKTAAVAEAMLQATAEDLLGQWATILSPADAAAVSGELAAYMIDSLQTGLGPGPGGWIDDGAAFVHPWGFDPADIAIPVQLWHGRQDRFVPFGHGRWLAGRIPGVDAHLNDTDGHLTLLRRVPDVHAWLLAQLRQT
jgi:pimeloyl-ACP methyl ester carboxylesterase